MDRHTENKIDRQIDIKIDRYLPQNIVHKIHYYTDGNIQQPEENQKIYHQMLILKKIIIIDLLLKQGGRGHWAVFMTCP